MKSYETIEVKEIKVAYVKGNISEELREKLIDTNADMYDDNGAGQYALVALQKKFFKGSDEYIALGKLIKAGYHYLEC